MRIRETLKVLFALLLAGLAAAEQPSIENARALLAKGELKEAAVVLHEVAAADPGNVDARILLGTTLSLQGKRSESIEQLLEAVRLQPDSARAHNTLGTVLSRFIETKAAREAFEKALQLDPNLAEARVNLALVLAQAGEFVLAGEHLDSAIQLQGDTQAPAYSHYLRAKIWVAQKELGNAASELETAVKLRPDYAEAWSDLGGIRRLNGEAKGAQQALERAVALNPDDDKAQYRLGVQCLQNAEPHSAVDHLRKALRHDPADRAALDLDPTDAVVRLNYGLALCRLGRWQEGAAELREVLRIDPNNAAAAKALYIAHDENEKQAAQAGKAVSEKPAQKN